MSNPTTGGSGGGGFRGFADFAQHTNFASTSGSTTAAATLAAARAAKNKQQQNESLQQQKQSTTTPTAANNNNKTTTLKSSPIYTGNNTQITLLFRKIGQKRDPITKVRALEELICVVYPPPPPQQSDSHSQQASSGTTSSNNSSNTNNNKDGVTTNNNIDTIIPRSEKIAVLCHLIYLHVTKLGFDNNSSVRAASYAALTAAKVHVPKAWRTLLLPSSSLLEGKSTQHV